MATSSGHLPLTTRRYFSGTLISQDGPVDRNLEALESAPRSNWARLGLAAAGSGLIMAVTSLFIATYPSAGYRAGYDAAIAKGPEWIDAEVHSADGTALRACERLHMLTVDGAVVEYSEFVQGCSDGIDHLYGRHVPVLVVGG